MAIGMASIKDTVTMESAMEALSPELSKDASRATSAIVGRRSSHKHTDFSPERSIESYGLLDLYSRAAFLTVLHTPRIYDSFSAFLCTEHSSENLVFWTRCELYKQRQRNLSDSLQLIDRQHLQVNSEEELNICHRSKTRGIQKLTNALHVLEETDRVFEELQDEVEMLMWRDTYPRFLKHHMAYNASKSLENPGRMSALNGLGECFCLTDPRCVPMPLAQADSRKPDNPIVMVSDAFIQVTGYPVSKIINHNCRFLQGSLSDRATIGRIRDAIKQGRESTEIFLNYRIDGTPFWNLLLVGIRSSVFC
jgi:PAS domain-containing protein